MEPNYLALCRNVSEYELGHFKNEKTEKLYLFKSSDQRMSYDFQFLFETMT